jgi:hypothetical protein
MKQYSVYIYRKDRRFKDGERLYSVHVIKDMTDETMQALYSNGYYGSPKFTDKFRVEYIPTMKVVTNLMTGKEMEIPHDTPRSCDPSTETFWSI